MPAVEGDVPSRTLLDEHLGRISKNFAARIRGLPYPYQEWVALSYLILRILDTIEDSDWKHAATQDKCFEDYENLLLGTAPLRTAERWAQSFPQSLTPHEQCLVSDSARLLLHFHNMPRSAQRIIQRTVVTMAAGMRIFLRQKAPINSVDLLNVYCFFVAGIVAELLVDLLVLLSSPFYVDQALIIGARHFGVALQKINMLNDMDVDKEKGRVFIWNRREVLGSLIHDVRQALRFFSAIPEHERAFRVFCQSSLLGALASLSLSEADSGNKLRPLDKDRLFESIAQIGGDLVAMETLTQKIFPSFGGDSGLKARSCLDALWLERVAPKEAAPVLSAYFAQTLRS